MEMLKLVRQVLNDTSGATAVEYGLIISMVVLAMTAALQGVANETISMWNDVDAKVTAANGN